MPGFAGRDDRRPGFKPAFLDPVGDPLELGVRDPHEQRHLLELMGVIGHDASSSPQGGHASRLRLRRTLRAAGPGALPTRGLAGTAGDSSPGTRGAVAV